MKMLARTQFGNPILRSRARNVPLRFLKTAKGKSLIKRMIYTMRHAHGIGLAAPQIGKALQLIVMETRSTPMRPKLKHRGPIIIVNPKMIKYSKNKIDGWEGCLSLDGVRGKVPRAREITVHYYNEKGEKVIEKALGLWARIFQHEIDHLNGVVYVDRIENTKTIIALSEFKKRVMKKK